MSKENVPIERNQQIVEFIKETDCYYGRDEGRKKWYKLISKRPEIISAEFFEMVNPLSGAQIDKVRAGYEAGLDIETIKIYAKPEFDASEMMHKILKGILSGIELDKIRLYAKLEFKGWINYLNDCAQKLDITTLKKYLDLELSVLYRVNILLVFMKNPNVMEKRVEVLCNDCWEYNQFDKLLLYVTKYEKISLEQLKVIANPKFNEYQMQEVAFGYMNGLKPEQVAFYAKPERHWLWMNYIRLGFENELSLRKIYFYSGKKFDSNMLKEVYNCFIEGLSLEKVKCIVDISDNDYRSVKLAKKILKAGYSIQELQEIANTSLLGKEMTFDYVLRGLDKGVSIEDIKFCVTTGHYYSSEMDELFAGFKNGLTQEQVKLFSGHEFRDGSMKIVRLCLEYGMSITLAKNFIANNQWDVMKAFIAYYEEQKTEETDLYTLISGLLN